MDTGVIIAIASLSFAVVSNALIMAYNYGRLNQKVKDMANHLTDLGTDMKEIGRKVSRVEGILNGRKG